MPHFFLIIQQLILFFFVCPFIYSSWIPFNKILEFPVYKSYTFFMKPIQYLFLMQLQMEVFS